MDRSTVGVGVGVGVEGMCVDVGAGSIGGTGVLGGDGSEGAVGEGVGRTVAAPIAICDSTGSGVADAVGAG